MGDQRVGRIVRALRRRRGWRQFDLAREAGCSQAQVSLLERGHLEHVSLPTVQRILAALEASLLIEVRWRGAALDRLLDDDHARLVAQTSELLRGPGWQTEIEVTYALFGERGSYDILAFHPAAGVALVVEIKTDLPSAEATLRKLDEKVRLAPRIARERFGWHVHDVGRLVVMPDTSTLRRRVDRHSGLFEQVLPVRGRAVRRWLAEPRGPLSGLWFLSPSDVAAVVRTGGGRHRVRRPKSPSVSAVAAA